MSTPPPTYEERHTELARLQALVDSVIGQDWQYGIRVWSEPAEPGVISPVWRRTDPHLNLEGYAFGWYEETPPPVEIYTREQYERAAAAVGLTPAGDDDLGGYADVYFQADVASASAIIALELALRQRRLAGLERERAPHAQAQREAAEQAQIAADRVEAEQAKTARRCVKCGAVATMIASLGESCDDCYDELSG